MPLGSTGCESLRPRDILLTLGGHDVDALGNYRHETYGKLLFHHIVLEGYDDGDPIPARVLRDGEVIDLELTARSYPASQQLVPWKRDDGPPPYLVAGGFVFRELDGSYLRSWGEGWRAEAPTCSPRRMTAAKSPS